MGGAFDAMSLQPTASGISMVTAPRVFLSPPDVGARERELMLAAFDSGYVAPAGPMLETFERAFADYVGLPHAVAMGSGTAALHVALKMLGVGPGDAIIAPTLTFIGGIAPIVYQGATPILVDCEPVCWGLDPQLLEPAFERATRLGLRVRAVMPTDLYGQVCEIDAIGAWCAEREIPVILDSAEAVGATWNGRHAGHGAMAAVYSFNGNKILTTSGGGMLASEDGELIARARYLSTAARQPVAWYEHTEVGFNYRMSNICAGIGLGQLESLERRTARRREIFEHYRMGLGNLPGVSFAPEGPGRRHTRWLTVMLLDPAEAAASPEAVLNALEAANIEARPLWKPMHMQPVFKSSPYVGGRVAETLFARGICLPSGSSMSDETVDRVCAVVKGALACRP
jgi:dTDP-4-amino-4,6-dideoxygalactose transaminase